MKLAFTGAHGIGKTTLAKWLADYMKIPYVPEYAREVLESGKKIDSLENFVDFEDSIMNMKIAEEERLEREGRESFIADRSYIDYSVYLKYGLSKYDWDDENRPRFKGVDIQDYFDYYDDQCRRLNEKYDIVVFVLPFTERLTSDGDHRDRNPFNMWVVQDLLFNEYGGEIGKRVVVLQDKALDRRKDFLIDLLTSRGELHGAK